MSTMIAAPPTKRTNFYQVHGYGLHISYSVAGIDGKPHFTYQDAHQTLQFSGDQIRCTPTDIGTLITVTIRQTIDSGSTTFTLMAPNVSLNTASESHIKTFGITTLHRFSVVPAFSQGQTELYTVYELAGSASFVAF